MNLTAFIVPDQAEIVNLSHKVDWATLPTGDRPVVTDFLTVASGCTTQDCVIEQVGPIIIARIGIRASGYGSPLPNQDSLIATIKEKYRPKYFMYQTAGVGLGFDTMNGLLFAQINTDGTIKVRNSNNVIGYDVWISLVYTMAKYPS